MFYPNNLTMQHTSGTGTTLQNQFIVPGTAIPLQVNPDLNLAFPCNQQNLEDFNSNKAFQNQLILQLKNYLPSLSVQLPTQSLIGEYISQESAPQVISQTPGDVVNQSQFCGQLPVGLILNPSDCQQSSDFTLNSFFLPEQESNVLMQNQPQAAKTTQPILIADSNKPSSNQPTTKYIIIPSNPLQKLSVCSQIGPCQPKRKLYPKQKTIKQISNQVLANGEMSSKRYVDIKPKPPQQTFILPNSQFILPTSKITQTAVTTVTSATGSTSAIPVSNFYVATIPAANVVALASPPVSPTISMPQLISFKQSECELTETNNLEHINEPVMSKQECELTDCLVPVTELVVEESKEMDLNELTTEELNYEMGQKILPSLEPVNKPVTEELECEITAKILPTLESINRSPTEKFKYEWTDNQMPSLQPINKLTVELPDCEMTEPLPSLELVNEIDVANSKCKVTEDLLPSLELIQEKPQLQMKNFTLPFLKPFNKPINFTETEKVKVSSETKDVKSQQPVKKLVCPLTEEKHIPEAIIKPQILTHITDESLIQEGSEQFHEGKTKEKHIPEAVIKPQILTHITDESLIQEGSEQFHVKPGLQVPPFRSLPLEKIDLNKKRENSPSPISSPEKKLKNQKRRGPGRPKKVKRGRKSKEIHVKGDLITKSISSNENNIEDEAINKLSTFINDPEGENKENYEEPADTSLTLVKDEKTNIHKIESVPSTQKLFTNWSVQNVCDFINNTLGCTDYADSFKSQEIDGQALLLLKIDHLVNVMSMKYGPAIKLISHINKLKAESGLS